MANGQGLIKARRRLSELFKTGVEIRFGGRYGLIGMIAPGGDGEFRTEDGALDPLQPGEVAMWVQPPSPLHRDMALRDANAARSRAQLAARDEDSAEYLAAREFIESMAEETLYDYILIADVDKRQQEAIREILAEEEWADITELQDSLRVFEEEERDEDDPEVVLVRKRQDDLQRQVAEREKELWEAAHDVMRMRGLEAAQKQGIERHVDLLTSRAFMTEYERQMTFYAVRDPDDHGVIFFESARDLAAQSDEVLMLIQTALTPFIQDGAEAKNSPRAESGSDSSVPPSKPATTAASTREESIG